MSILSIGMMFLGVVFFLGVGGGAFAAVLMRRRKAARGFEVEAAVTKEDSA